MKNKKSLLGLGLLALVLVLGVGYAVVSNVELTFGGTATAATEELSVDIDSVVVEKPDGVTVSADVVQHSKDVTFTVSNMTLNQTVKLTYTVVNHEKDVVAKLTEKTGLTNSGNEYFQATYSITGGDSIAVDGGTATVTVSIKMVKTPVSDNGQATFKFVVDAAAVQ